MYERIWKAIAPPLLVLTVIATACATAPNPTAVIASPPSGSTYHEGDEVAVQSSCSDAAGVVRVEMTVDGAVVRDDAPPSPQTDYTVIQTWKAAPGSHTIVVRAYNAAGAASNPAAISVSVNPQSVVPTAIATTIVEVPTTVPPTAGAAACTNDAAFVTDVSIPDGTSVTPGQKFDKVWRVKNTGTCPWTTEYDLAFVGGESMAAINAVAVPETAPGNTADLLVSLTAPATPGAHAGQWKLRNVRDSYFGGAVTVAVNVVDTSAQPPPTEQPPAQPAQTGCSGTPNIASFTASPTSFGIHGGDTTLTWGEVTNADSVEIDNGIGGVATPGSTTAHVTQDTTFTLTAHCGSNTKTAQATVTVLNLHILQPAVPFLIFKVTGASASKTSVSCGAHDATSKFAGTITANGSGTVTYKWENSNAPSGGATLSLVFGSAGTLAVQTKSLTSSETGQMYVHVLSPTDMTSNKVTFPGCP